MAKFPIYTTERSVPGTSGSTYQRFGGEQVGQAMQQAGGAVARAGTSVFIQQGKVQIADITAQNQADIRKMFYKFDESNDEDSYQEIFEATWSGITARAEGTSNGFARRHLSLQLPGMKEKQQGYVDEAFKKKVKDKMQFQVITAATEAADTGNMGKFSSMLSSMVQDGDMTAEEAQARFDIVDHKAAVNQMAAQAWNDPEEFLANYNTWDKLKAGDSRLVPQDQSHLVGMAMHAKSAAAQVTTEAMKQAEQNLWDISLDPNTTTEDFAKAIDSLPPDMYSLEDRDRFLKSGVSRMKLMAAGNGDPLKVRQDYTAYKELVFKARAGTLTEAEARKAVNANKITITDYEHLVNVIEGNAKASSQLYDYADAVDMMDDMINGSMYSGSPLREEAKVKAQRVLEDKMTEATEEGRPLKGRELQNEALRVVRQVQKEATLSPSPEDFLSIPKTRGKEGKVVRGKDGGVIGKYLNNTEIQLTVEGLRKAIEYATRNNWTKEQFLSFLKDNDYVMPDEIDI